MYKIYIITSSYVVVIAHTVNVLNIQIIVKYCNFTYHIGHICVIWFIKII